MRPLVAVSRELLWKIVDAKLIDGIVNRTALRTRRFGDVLRGMQSGNIRSYANWVLAGALVLIAFMVAVTS